MITGIWAVGVIRSDLLAEEFKNLSSVVQTDWFILFLSQKLSEYVESVMGDYVILKTHRVMPWKFEYINEVYNTLALAYTDTFTVAENLLEIKEQDRLLVLLRMPTDKFKDIVQFVFGDKSTYQEPDAPDYALIAYKSDETYCIFSI